MQARATVAKQEDGTSINATERLVKVSKKTVLRFLSARVATGLD